MIYRFNWWLSISNEVGENVDTQTAYREIVKIVLAYLSPASEAEGIPA